MLSNQKNRNDNLTKEATTLKTKLNAKKCAVGWQYFDGSCYYLSTDEMNWTESRDACVNMGGHLVIIKSTEEMNFLTDVGQNDTAWETRFWMGLIQEEQEGRWYWLDNETLSNTTFWFGNNPNDWKGDGRDGEDCGLVILRGTPSYPNRGWNDGGCHAILRRICEAKSCSI